MNCLDTNVILRFLLNDIPSQSQKAKRVLLSPPVYISDVVVAEAVYVLEKSRGYSRKHVASLIRVLMAIPGIVYSDHLLPKVIDAYENKKSLSFVDCYASIEAEIFGSNLYTFDKKLLNQGGSHVLAP